jgi:acetyl-CoA C-acetyltransferase
MSKEAIVIVSYARTPQGNFNGELKDFTAPQLGAHAIKALLDRSHIDPSIVAEVLMGCVLPAGLGQAPARQASILAGLAATIPCTTVNKVCGSGMKTVMIAHDQLLANGGQAIIAGGMESMSNAPYLLLKGRQGYRIGHQVLYDHMMLDGLEDAYDKGKAMGYFAELTAEKYHFSREMQDQYARKSFERAQAAIKNHLFDDEIVPIYIQTKQGEKCIAQDEHPFSVNIERLTTLASVFKKDGTITAGNASSIAEGAAALLLMKESVAQRHGLTPIARILGHSSYASAPEAFTTAPIGATKSLLAKLDWDISKVDLFEINEAFAVVPMAFIHDLKVAAEKVNIHGGGCALGHPIGASGTRIIVSLIAELSQQKLQYGIASLCIGGGEATALAIEMCS